MGSEVVQELVAEDEVHEEELDHGQDEAEELERQQVAGAGVVPLGVGGEEVGEASHLVRQGDLGQRILAEVGHQLAHPAALRLLPQRPGDVADAGLQHQQQTHPLVVVVVHGAFLRRTRPVLVNAHII